uniref:PDZ domain-containing protein n=1 Tax=Guillardia theta TaxID=55529 RepID=A0A7S4KAG7_GUITH|mmetsp:Transcript_2229/g.6773  ORF Transcript_2229/g.6773 Transcript_2229/m.6773 type:complete len:1089 (+) Transcript_2229:141-3407(+)
MLENSGASQDAGNKIATFVKSCLDAPASLDARKSIVQLHSICRTTQESALLVANGGGIIAAHRMLSASNSKEALGILWTLSSYKTVVDGFTPEVLWDVVRICRTSKDPWRQTAAISTLHNLLCFNYYEKVLTAGALELAIELVCNQESATNEVKAACALLLDQCCFDKISKQVAVQAVELKPIIEILEKQTATVYSSTSSSDKTGGGQSSSADVARDAADLRDSHDAGKLLIGNLLSFLWNATDDLYYSDPAGWSRFTIRACEPELLKVLNKILVHGDDSERHAVGAILHNFSCNRSLHDRLLENGVVDMITQTVQKDEDVHICCLLAAAELCGSEESGKHCNILHKFNAVYVLVSDLRKRCGCYEDYSVNEREVSLRKLLSALENIASSDVHKGSLLKCGVIDVIYDVISKRIVDHRGMTLGLRTLLHLSFERSAIQDLLHPRLVKLIADTAKDDQIPLIPKESAKTLDYRLKYLRDPLLLFPANDHKTQSYGARWLRHPEEIRILTLSYHESDLPVVSRIRSSLLSVGYAFASSEDSVETGSIDDFIQCLQSEPTDLLVCMSKSYQVSARARFTTELALSRGLHLVRLNIEASFHPFGWLAQLASMQTKDGDREFQSEICVTGATAMQLSVLIAALGKRNIVKHAATDPASNDPRKGPSSPRSGFDHSRLWDVTPRGRPRPALLTQQEKHPDKLGLLLIESPAGEICVARVSPEGSAGRSGLVRERDVLLAVDGKEVKGISVTRVIDIIRNARGDEDRGSLVGGSRGGESTPSKDKSASVELLFSRGGQELCVVLPRPPVSSHTSFERVQWGLDHEVMEVSREGRMAYDDHFLPANLRARSSTGASTARARIETSPTQTNGVTVTPSFISKEGSPGRPAPAQQRLAVTSLGIDGERGKEIGSLGTDLWQGAKPVKSIVKEDGDIDTETRPSVRTAALSARFILSLRSVIIDAGWFPSSELSRREDVQRVERSWLTWRLKPAKETRREAAAMEEELDKVVRMTPSDVSRWLRDEELEGVEQVLHGGSDGRSVVELVKLLRRDEKMLVSLLDHQLRGDATRRNRWVVALKKLLGSSRGQTMAGELSSR